MTSETMEIVLGCMEFIKFLVGSHTTVRRNAGASVFYSIYLSMSKCNRVSS